MVANAVCDSIQKLDPAPEPADEAALIAAAQRHPAAFAPLYERYVDRVYRYAYRRLGNHADAEDVTAQTFQQALAALPSYEWRGVPFGAWLYRIAGNVIVQSRRRGAREVAGERAGLLLASQPSPDDDPSLHLDRAATSDALLAAIRRLPLTQQQVLILKYAHGLTNREVAHHLGRTEGAVKQLTHRAMLSLRGVLASAEVEGVV